MKTLKLVAMLTTIVIVGVANSFAAPIQLGTTDTFYELTGEADNLTITISGTGKMPGYNIEPVSGGAGLAPWHNVRENIKHCIINDGITHIGANAFMYTNISEVVIPNSVISINGGAFQGISTLGTVYIGSSVSQITMLAFSSSNITSLTVHPANLYYTVEDGVLFNIDKTALVVYCAGRPDAEYKIPYSVTTILAYAFYGAKNINSVTIPYTVKKIGEGAFLSCSNITSITCQSLVPLSIDSKTFMYVSDANKKLCTLYVPTEAVAAYESAQFWRVFTILGGVGIMAQAAHKLQLSPNPVDNQAILNFSLLQSANIEVKICTLAGSELQAFSGYYENGDNTYNLDLHNYPTGTYICNMLINGEVIGTTKFIKK